MDYEVFPDSFYGYEDYSSAIREAAGEIAAATFAGSLLVILLAVYIVVMMFALAQYLINAIAFMRMAKKVGIPNGWLSFIPFADVYLIGKIADVSSKKKINAKRLLITEIIFTMLLVLYMILAFSLGALSAISDGVFAGGMIAFLVIALLYFAAAVCLTVFAYIAYYRIAQNFGGSSDTGWFVGILLGGLLVSSLVPTVLLLILSFKTPEKTVGSTKEEPIPVEASDSVF